MTAAQPALYLGAHSDTRPIERPAGMPDSQWRVLHQLAKGPACTVELGQGGHRFGARIKELRDAGWQIDRRPCQRAFHHHTTRVYEYLLVGRP